MPSVIFTFLLTTTLAASIVDTDMVKVKDAVSSVADFHLHIVSIDYKTFAEDRHELYENI